MNARIWKSLIIGLGLPIVGVLVIMPLLADSTIHVFGVPLLLMWIFVMFPLTSLCLWLAWRIDEPYYRDAPGQSAEGGL
jgi:predicted ABC-type exoprotein transport system permease subunit